MKMVSNLGHYLMELVLAEVNEVYVRR